MSIQSNASTNFSLLKISSERGGIPSFIGNELTPDVSSCVFFMKEIPLTQGQVALVDDADYDWLNQWKWCAQKDRKTFYVIRGMGRKTIRMHRVILGITDSKILGDHRDHNGLNNQRSNLRVSNHSGNSRNRSSANGASSKYLGVYSNMNIQRKYGRQYVYRRIQSSIRVNNKIVHLGSFKTEIEAARAYDEAAKKHYGEFANLNFKS